MGLKSGENSEDFMETENTPQTQAQHSVTSPSKQTARIAANRSSPSKLPMHFDDESELEIEAIDKPKEVMASKGKPNVQEQLRQSQENVDIMGNMQNKNDTPIMQRDEHVYMDSRRKSLLTPAAYRIPNYDMW